MASEPTDKRSQILELIAGLDYDCIGLIDLPASTLTFLMYGEGYAAPSFLSLPETGKAVDYDTLVSSLSESALIGESGSPLSEDVSLSNIISHLDENGRFAIRLSMLDAQGHATHHQLRYHYLDDDKQQIVVVQHDDSDLHGVENKLIEQLKREQRLREEAITANESKSVFLSSISHDIRTPLNGVVGFTNLALQTNDSEVMRDYLQKIKKSGSLMLDLVNDTLMLSKIENGKGIVENEIIDNYEMLDHVTVPIQASAAEKGLDFTVDTSHLRHCLVNTDRMNLQKIFLNLLSNAVRFTPMGGTVVFTVEDTEPDEQGRNFRATVSDTGIGIDPAFLPKIYEPFSQELVGIGLNKADTGTGLGLFIVRQLVNLMNGTIEAKSSLGAGTTFTVRLAIEPADDAHLSEEMDDDFEGRVLTGLKVLLCEDNYLNTEIARTLLEQRGAEVVCAENGLKGVQSFSHSSENEYDAVLMDIRMPIMDGYQATETIRSLSRPDAQNIPIIALTADAYPEDVKKCLAVGMNAHIAKPVNPNLLTREIIRYCMLRDSRKA